MQPFQHDMVSSPTIVDVYDDKTSLKLNVGDMWSRYFALRGWRGNRNCLKKDWNGWTNYDGNFFVVMWVEPWIDCMIRNSRQIVSLNCLFWFNADVVNKRVFDWRTGLSLLKVFTSSLMDTFDIVVPLLTGIFMLLRLVGTNQEQIN